MKEPFLHAFEAKKIAKKAHANPALIERGVRDILKEVRERAEKGCTTLTNPRSAVTPPLSTESLEHVQAQLEILGYKFRDTDEGYTEMSWE